MCKNLHFDVFNDGLKIVSRCLQEDHHIFIRPGSATVRGAAENHVGWHVYPLVNIQKTIENGHL
jgi:hypothetical protein